MIPKIFLILRPADDVEQNEYDKSQCAISSGLIWFLKICPQSYIYNCEAQEKVQARVG